MPIEKEDVSSMTATQRLAMDIDHMRLQAAAQPQQYPSPIRRFGIELEFNLMDTHFNPSFSDVHVLQKLQDNTLCQECCKNQLEWNETLNFPIEGKFLSTLHQTMQKKMQYIQQATQKDSIYPLWIGSSPHLPEKDYLLDHIHPDYREIFKKITHLREMFQNDPRSFTFTQKLKTFINMSLLNSLQINIELNPNQCMPEYHTLCALSAPILSIATNAPAFNFHEQTMETRIFTSESHYQGNHCRIALGLPVKTLQQYFEYVAAAPILKVPQATSLHPFAQLQAQCSSHWFWNRLKIDPHNLFGHICIESRFLPAGPTAIDMAANAAFYLGLQQFYQTRLCLDQYARTNLYQAAIHGLDATLIWQCKPIKAQTLVQDILIDQCHQGLQQLKCDPKDIHTYLSIIQERCLKKQTGSHWQIAWKEKRGLHDLLAQYHRWQNLDVPVHLWDI
jgi:hypothetical protein